MKDERKCCLCGMECEEWIGGHGFGHNADPLAEGRCCDECHAIKVVPARFKRACDQRYFSALSIAVVLLASSTFVAKAQDTTGGNSGQFPTGWATNNNPSASAIQAQIQQNVGGNPSMSTGANGGLQNGVGPNGTPPGQLNAASTLGGHK